MATLKERIAALRGQAGTGPGTAPEIGERLRRLRPLKRRPAESDDALATRLGGECLDAGLIRIERRVDLAGRHGERPLAGLGRALIHPEEGRPLEAGSLLFFDTETTGLAGGSGTLAFLLGLARVEGAHLRVRQYLLTTFAAEAAMLRAACEWFEEAAAVVSFNGKSFDAPLLSARFRLAGHPDPLPRREHIDLLHPVRRTFAKCWRDCRLQTAERELLGFARRGDLPGAEVPQVWSAFLRWGDAERIPDVVRHNHWDLISLGGLLDAFAALQARPEGFTADVAALADAWLSRGNEPQAYALLRKAEASLDAEGLLLLAKLCRRRGDWQAASGLWQELAAQGELRAIEALAKFYEHVRRDYRQALVFAERLGADAEQEHRRRRLRARLASS